MTSPLSQAQLSMFLASQGLDDKSGNYQQALLFKLPPTIDIQKLKTALEAFVTAHPYILSHVKEVDGVPCMEQPQETWKAQIKEIDSIDQVRRSFAQPMDLYKDRLFRLELYKTPEASYFYADFHHIIADGACIPIMLQDLGAAYDGQEVAAEKMSGADIAREEQQQRESEAFEEAKQWFGQEFGPATETESRIVPDVFSKEVLAYKELMVELPLDSAAMREVLERYRYADSILFTTIFGLTLASWNADNAASFSTIWNGRKGVAARTAFTMCVHTLPAYVNATPDTPVSEVLDRMKAQTMGLRARHFFSMADCGTYLGLGPGINFGFQGQFVVEVPSLILAGERIPGEDLRTNPPGLNLTVELFTPASGPYMMRFWYRPSMYSEGILKNFAESMAAAILSLKTADTVGQMDFATPAQIKILDGFNPGKSVGETEKTVLDFWRQRIEEAPEQLALVCADKQLTYKEVDILSDKLAAHIVKTVKPGSVVSIILGRSEYTVIAPLGVLKAGCAYQPLDPSYPTDRLQFMVKDASAALLIADEGLAELVEGFEGPVLPTADIPGLPAGKPKSNPRPDDLFVLLYTSGTTGKPKGCMLNHRNVSLFAQHHAWRTGISAKSKLTAYSSFGFDAFVGDLYGALVSGASLYLIPEELRLDLKALHDYFERNGITHSFMTTQVATQFAINYPSCKGLQVLYTGGEKLSSLPLPEYRLFNCYGPSESLCYVVSKEVKKQEMNIPVGIPQPGIHCFIVNKAGKRLPVGAAGELLEAGLQVGDGYLGRPDKTAEAFADNPYEADPAFRRMYRTGDIVRFRADGDIEYIGRKDAQVKIRGFRIELKEVEGVIRDYPGIKDVTVQAFDQEGGGKFLAAYVVSDENVDATALNAFILERKPPYMVPSVTMQIDAIPLNVNQKVDVKALPKPQAHKAENQAAAPLNLLEQELATLLKETTGIEGASLTEPLMLYGLSSLSGLRLATELFKRYGVQADMNSFAKTATLQSIENEILKIWMAGDSAVASSGDVEMSLRPQPLTNQQSGVFLDCMKAPQETIYNIPMVWTFPGEVSAQALQEAVEKVLAAHPALRSHFEQIDGQVCQVPSDTPIPVSIMNGELQTLKENFILPFDLNKGPLGKVAIVPGNDKTYLLSDFHHLIFDGRSYDIFIQEVCAALEGKDIAPESYTYFQYAAWQKAAEGSEAYAQARDFFAGQLSELESPSTVIPDLEHGDQAGREVFLQKFVQADIHPLCKKLGISPASFFLGAAYLTLSAYNANKKVHICTISNGRGNLKTADSFGMFVNTLALSGDCTLESTEDFLKKCDKDFQATLQHQDYPFAKIAAEFGFQPQVMLAYQVGVLADYRVNGQPVKGENLDAGAPKFPLSIYIDGTEGNEAIVLGYDNSKYSEALMAAFADAMECVVRGLLHYEKLREVPFVDGERLKELESFNHFSQKVDGSQTIVSLFREQARITPDAPAVCYEDFSCTYAQADALTDRIAAAIAAKGLKTEDVVSVLIGRNQWMALASLGILKAGCAYQPLDPSYPQERLNFMVGDASARLLIADKELLPILKEYKGPVLTTDQLESLPEGPVPEGPKPENLFILLYTSGSTGVPKGVMLEHHNLVNFCAWYQKYYKLTDHSRVAAYASYGFDACMMDMYPVLTAGGYLHIIPEETRHDMSQLDAFITDNGITHSFMTTQVGVMYAKNFPDNKSLKHLSVGGEKLVSMDPPSYGFHNGYGPTECTIFSTIFDVKKREANIPIGHALDNTSMYVMDGDFRRVPVGAAGELLITGAGVGRGYLNRPEKTAETFIDNPFRKGERAYRSGDIVRWRTDGNIEFVGRQDGQVKIRGFRIELKEVEEVLRECPGVKDVTVQAFDNPSGGKFIAAYVVAEEKFDIQAASAFIKERKPPYMVPAAFVQLDKIPLNVNQKVDRKALPKPTPDTSAEYVAPETDLEKNLCEIFAEVLGLEKIGALDNFFDLGGSSLMVTNVLVSAEKRGLKFAYADVFSHPTARDLASFLNGGVAAPKEDGEVSDYDYSAIDALLAGNTLEALQNGKSQSLEGQILLTGATGFLGIHMLRDLVESTSEKTVIWCLLRPKGTLSAERRLKEMLVYYFEKDYRPLLGKRIRIINGDITKPAVFDSLKNSGIHWSVVVNCAANVKHFSKGTDIEDINYGGVKNLCTFCEATSARLVHVSTESVAGMSPGSHPNQLSEQQLYFGQLTANQYVHSKFLAERYILERMAAGALNGKILRAGNLSPRSADGEFQVNLNANSAMGRLRAYKLLGACPYSLLDSKMEFSPIDDSARAMILLAQTPRENCVFNVSNNHLLPMEDIVSRLRLIDGNKVEYVEFPEFSTRVQAVMAQPDKAPLLSALVAYAQSPTDQEMVMNQPSVHFTMQVLYRLGFCWDHTSSAYVDMIFDMLRTLQYFD